VRRIRVCWPSTSLRYAQAERCEKELRVRKCTNLRWSDLGGLTPSHRPESGVVRTPTKAGFRGKRNPDRVHKNMFMQLSAPMRARQRSCSFLCIALVILSVMGCATPVGVRRAGTRFWDNISKTPLDQLTMEPETRELLRQSLFVTPLPFVKRVVFISTPHRGSYLAGRRLGHLASWLVALPGDLTQRTLTALT
jgi:hypothetical protein